MKFEVFGIVKSGGKVIAIGDNGVFETDSEKIIYKLDNLGFKRLDSIPVKEEIPHQVVLVTEEKPKVKKVTKTKKVKK